MKTTLIIFALALVAISAVPLKFEGGNNDAGESYLFLPLESVFSLLPLDRHRREAPANQGPATSLDLHFPDLKGVVKHEGTIAQNDKFHLTGNAYAGKDLKDPRDVKPDVFGGDVKLTHETGLEAGLGADHFRGGPTNVKAGLNYPLYQDKNFKFDVGAEYSKQIGGPLGAGQPNAGVFLNGVGRW